MASAPGVTAHNSAYDHADDEVWQTLVYKPVHGGREFTNIGGRAALNRIAGRCVAAPGRRLLEIGCGLGAACIYLAESYGCCVTGVDANPFQVRAAGERLAQRPPLPVRFVEGDFLVWRTDERFDGVYSLDSIMLIPDADAAIANAASMLAPGGVLAFAEMTAGPTITSAAREYAFREDGIHLRSEAQLRGALTAAGLADIDAVDLTRDAEECFAAIHSAARRSAANIRGIARPGVLENWLGLSARYRDGFRGRQYEYWLVSAARPA